MMAAAYKPSGTTLVNEFPLFAQNDRDNCFKHFLMSHSSYANEGHLNKDATKSIFYALFYFKGCEELLEKYLEKCRLCKEGKKLEFEGKRSWQLVCLDLDISENHLPSLYSKDKLRTACVLDNVNMFLRKQAIAKLGGKTNSVENKEYISNFCDTSFASDLKMRALNFIKATNEAHRKVHNVGYDLNAEFPISLFRDHLQNALAYLKFKNMKKESTEAASPRPSQAEATVRTGSEQRPTARLSRHFLRMKEVMKTPGGGLWSLHGGQNEEPEGEQSASSGSPEAGGSGKQGEAPTDLWEVDLTSKQDSCITIRKVGIHCGEYADAADTAISYLSGLYEFQYPKTCGKIEPDDTKEFIADMCKRFMHTILSTRNLDLSIPDITSRLPAGTSLQEHFLAVLSFQLPKRKEHYVVVLEVITPLWLTRCLWEELVEDLNKLDYLEYVVKYLDEQLVNMAKARVEIRLYIPVSNYAVPLLSNECYKTVDVHIIPDCFVEYFLGPVIYPLNYIISNTYHGNTSQGYTKPEDIATKLTSLFNRTWKRGRHTPFEQACLLVQESSPAKYILNDWLQKERQTEGYS